MRYTPDVLTEYNRLWPERQMKDPELDFGQAAWIGQPAIVPNPLRNQPRIPFGWRVVIVLVVVAVICGALVVVNP